MLESSCEIRQEIKGERASRGFLSRCNLPMLSCCSCFTSDDSEDHYMPLPTSPTNGLAEKNELLLVTKQSASPVNLVLLDEGLVVTRRKNGTFGWPAAVASGSPQRGDS